MKTLFFLTTALIAASTIQGGHAVAANVCRADPLVCPTTMPVDGFCQCRSGGTTVSGTVTAVALPHDHYNASSGGCGAHPNDPGCRAMPAQVYEAPAQPPDMPPPPVGMPTIPPPPSMPPPPPG